LTASPDWLDADRQPVLRVEDDPDADDIAWLDDQLTAFTLAATRHAEIRPLAVIVRDGDRLAGGIHGWSWGGCCELVSLWVEESRRGRGLGRALLLEAEAEARRRECIQLVLFTHAEQAPQLYLALGYQVVGAVEDYPAGSAAYWFRKALSPAAITPVGSG
jgi:ribosomal protein S18 acetylase RimI-like enzyme